MRGASFHNTHKLKAGEASHTPTDDSVTQFADTFSSIVYQVSVGLLAGTLSGTNESVVETQLMTYEIHKFWRRERERERAARRHGGLVGTCLFLFFVFGNFKVLLPVRKTPSPFSHTFPVWFFTHLFRGFMITYHHDEKVMDSCWGAAC